ncbi:UDP-3-O-(3-hydroxymyristoyl)glucosamine N-acyltransferase [Neptuniibacter caesariensis]|uniref:UDP-3-O-acylglucosamine N-acyltransferase n=1 Tax=Neptuniibacter caesariensis TaxID=207954 RepID=A0A7U8CAE6_NEPCE|nr:UDP-3-O-(3-hydroxymyristoyl)glucosamine N-acyltransferase [Neptuniibacter caesariensis]EAR63050.1 UDP-3-O-[3-hydroxymyristoyl] glucosamine N-acyltransferase [Oceanospirillum sp. MED92] [Neptuniibacter caesariensis]
MTQAGFTLQEISEFLSAELIGNPDCKVESIATLQNASKEQIAFVSNTKYQRYLAESQAAAIIMTRELAEGFVGNVIVMDDPYLGYAKLSRLFERKRESAGSIHVNAVIHPTAKISDGVTLAAGVVIGADTEIMADVIIGENTVVGQGCSVGKGSIIKPNVTLYDDVSIGSDSLIHSGAVLGSDGFGFANDGEKWVKIAQLGGVRIGSNVEIGACTTIDRGALENTVISDGVILDNQIQIAHNVKIGKNTAIAGCTAVAGSTKIGDRCTIAGACGITGHLDIADGTHITAMTLVSKSIDKPGAFSSGTGMMPHKQWKKNVVRFKQLDDIARRLKSIEEKISKD